MNKKPFAYQPLDHELEAASNSYLMSLVAIIVGVPLPIINLFTDGSVQIDSKEDYVEGDLSLDGSREFNSLNDLPMKIRGRGNSTWYTHPKKPYQMKLSNKSAFVLFLHNIFTPQTLHVFS